MTQNLSHSDDPGGNIQTITNNLNGARSQSFTYDDLNRLETASGLYGSQSYGIYDGVGNRLSTKLAGVAYTYTPSATSNQIVRITTSGGARNFFYQAQGQLGTDWRSATSQYEFAYNKSGRMTTANRNNLLLATYTYNGFEERAIKAAATTTDFIYDRAGHLLAEANAATGAMIREYIWMDDTPVAMVDDTGTNPVVYDIHSDHLGRPQKLTTQSAGLAWDGVFDPFGNVTSVSGSVTMLLMFPGQYYDSETQLSQNWNRDYDPTIGRYIQSDPIGLWSGIHTYAYVGGRPVVFTDETGLFSVNLFPNGSAQSTIPANWSYLGGSDSGWFSAGTHGSPGQPTADGAFNAISMYRFEQDIEANGWKPGQPIELDVCYAGALGPNGGKSIAQALANDLGVPVWAPIGLIHFAVSTNRDTGQVVGVVGSLDSAGDNVFFPIQWQN